VEVSPVSFEELSGEASSEDSQAIRQRVVNARKIQGTRYKESLSTHCNAQMSKSEFDQFCKTDLSGQKIIKLAMEKLGLSARAYDRILKVARTIADLEGNEKIEVQHVAEAIQFRSLDKGNWGSN
jgi:magnesium chelatase family protein